MPDFTRLKSVLLSSGLQHQNPALFQVIDQLLTFMGNVPGATVGNSTGGGGGSVGPPGPAGPQGFPGVTILGNDGEDGEIGPPGIQGPAGAAGATGATGATGLTGPPGMDGQDAENNEPFIIQPTTSQLLDLLFNNPQQGSILFRDAQLWTLLAPGSVVGYFLQTAGAGANPVWSAVGAGPSSPFQAGYSFDYWTGIASGASWQNTYGQSGTITDATGAAVRQTKDSQPYFNLQTLASTNSTSSFTGATGGTLRDLDYTWNWDISFAVRTDANTATNVRFLVGTGVNIENADTGITSANVSFRYSTSAGDTGWVGITSDGTQATTAQVGANIADNTAYILRIRKVGGTVFFSVNGSTEVSTSSHVPTSSTPTRMCGRITALANSARILWVSRAWATVG